MKPMHDPKNRHVDIHITKCQSDARIAIFTIRYRTTRRHVEIHGHIYINRQSMCRYNCAQMLIYPMIRRQVYYISRFKQEKGWAVGKLQGRDVHPQNNKLYQNNEVARNSIPFYASEMNEIASKYEKHFAYGHDYNNNNNNFVTNLGVGYINPFLSCKFVKGHPLGYFSNYRTPFNYLIHVLKHAYSPCCSINYV